MTKNIAAVLAALMAMPGSAVWSQSTNPVIYPPPNKTPTPAGAIATSPASKELKAEEIDQLVAPIALYPDSLLSQILMASTYPVEVVQAERWAKQNKSLTGDALAKALEPQTWDPSVKSLVNFPDVLTMMSDKLDWTVKLGDAFLENQKPVMDAVQRLRTKAQAQGNLKNNDQQKVVIEQAPATQTTTTTNTQIIKIEPTNPQVVYVPTYNPTVVYGGWPYPSYPPYSYYPPGYVAGAAAVSFGVGLAVGAAWGYAWGGCNWGHSEVDIDIDQNLNINSNIDRDKFKAEQGKRQAERDTRQGERQTGRDTRQGERQGSRSSFQHDPSHRQGVTYRDNATAQKFGGQSSAQAAQSREAYRGRADAGRQDIARGGADQFRGAGGNTRAPSVNNTGNRPAPSANRGSSSNRPSNTGTRSNAYNGINQGGNATRNYSQRGSSSRSGSSSSGGSRGGGSRGGGGGRGGGGRR